MSGRGLGGGKERAGPALSSPLPIAGARGLPLGTVAVEWVWPLAVVLLGCSVTLTLAGVGAGDLEVALAGGAGAALALVLLMTADRLDPLAVLVLSLPLPALAAAGDLRLSAAAPLTVFVAGVWFLAWGPSRLPIAARRFPWVAVGALVFAYGLSTLFTEHRVSALREVLNLLSLLALLLVAADMFARRPARVRVTVLTLAAVAGVSGALAVLEAGGVIPGQFPQPGGPNRAALGFGQPNGLGLFLALCLPLALHAIRECRAPLTRWAAGAGAVAVVAGLVATFSRGSALSVLLGSFALALAGRRRVVARVWGGALLAALVADVASGGAVRETIVGVVTDWSVAQRAALMLAGVRLFLENPLLGVGPGGFADELARAGVLVPELWDLQPTPHNAYVQAAAETGVVGLVAFLGFLLVLFRRLLRLARAPAPDPLQASLRAALLWSFGVAVVEGMVEWPLTHGHGQVVVLVAAAGIALASPPDRPPAGRDGAGAHPDLTATARDPVLLGNRSPAGPG